MQLLSEIGLQIYLVIAFFTDQDRRQLLIRFKYALSDQSLPIGFLNFYITQLITMLCVNILALIGVGYLFVLHIYLRHRGLTTYQFIMGDKYDT